MKKLILSVAFVSLLGGSCLATQPMSLAAMSAGMVSASSSSSDVDDMLDEYEKYVDNYIKYVKKAAKGDMSALAEYAKLQKQAQTLANKIEKCKGEMDSEQMARYLKITQKMANAME